MKDESGNAAIYVGENVAFSLTFLLGTDIPGHESRSFFNKKARPLRSGPHLFTPDYVLSNPSPARVRPASERRTSSPESPQSWLPSSA